MAVAVLHSREVKTIADARRAFAKFPSPWIIGAAIVAALVARIVVGEWSWRDAVAAVAMLVVYPFGEWAIHVYILHAKPFKLFGRRIDMAPARDHRSHHRIPNNLNTILLGPRDLVDLLALAVPVVVGAGVGIVTLAFGSVPLGPIVTAVLTSYVTIWAYEWSHFLIHTSYRPRTRYYRAIWQNHRLHHFKNEHYWHGITTTLADRAIGTHPDHTEVPRSTTARELPTA